VRAADEIRLVRQNLSLAMSVWRAASEGVIPPEAILGPPPETPSEWAESAVDQYSRLTRSTANQVRASFSLAALQAHRSLDSLFSGEPIDEEPPDLQAARSVLYLVHRAVDRAMLTPAWDCPPRYRRLFEVRPVRFVLDAADIHGHALKWDDFGGLDKYLDLMDYCVHVAGSRPTRVAQEPVLSPSDPPVSLETLLAPDVEPARPPTGPRLAPSSSGRFPAVDTANSVQSFVAARCEIGPHCRSLAGDLYSGYVAWCQANGQPPLPQRSFGMRLTDLGLERKRRGRGKHWWEGVRLANQAGKASAPAVYSANGRQE
jgi:hypothetical protein